MLEVIVQFSQSGGKSIGSTNQARISIFARSLGKAYVIECVELR